MPASVRPVLSAIGRPLSLSANSFDLVPENASSDAGSQCVLPWSVQNSPRQFEHAPATRLGRTYALGDKIYFRCPDTTAGARKQNQHVVAAATERLRAAVRHFQYDRLASEPLFE